MPDKKYCYPGSDVLINKLGITNAKELFDAEVELTFMRLSELSYAPIKGVFDFKHLKQIHKYIFQDVYAWAGKVRTVEIGKGNLFCLTAHIQDYADIIFKNYYPQCNMAKEDKEAFIKALAKNYGELNALHPFREGNGRAQREFARLVCLDCGYNFNLAVATHEEMLAASQLSFNKGDNVLFERIFSRAISEITEETPYQNGVNVLTSDDLTLSPFDGYNYDEYNDDASLKKYRKAYNKKYKPYLKK